MLNDLIYNKMELRFIILQLKGGLGNQMFQYVYLRHIFKGNIYYTENLLLTRSSFQTIRNNEIKLFEISKLRKLNKLFDWLLFSNSLVAKLFKKIFNKYFYSYTQDQLIPKIRFGFVLVSGYYQNYIFFNSERELYIKQFKFPVLDEHNLLILNKFKIEENPVALHIRRGDYLNSKFHFILKDVFYHKSIDFIKKNLRNYKFIVFVEFIDEFTREILEYIENYILVDTNAGIDSWKDMCLMASCKHHIIANSTFSWWGANLATEKGFKIAPKNWYLDEKYNTEYVSNILSNEWIVID